MTPRRLRVGVLMGGASSERVISLASGHMIAAHLPRDKYEPVMLDTLALMARHPSLPPALAERARALLSGEHSPEDFGGLPEEMRLQIQEASQATAPATAALTVSRDAAPIDVAFIALHGPYGEDGTLQGMLDLLGVPYVGSGTLASALAMDKVMAKRVLAAEGILVPDGIVVERSDYEQAPDRALEGAPLPAVVKPSREGSSIGMSLVSESSELPAALQTAFASDSRVLVEERLEGSELSVGLIGNRELLALPVIEIVPKREFFDYKAKYDASLCDEICPARIPEAVALEAQTLAEASHRALECRGLSRVDMIQDRRGLVVLEVNTMPGMTINSLLPKAAATAGIPFDELLDRLVQLALEGQPEPRR